jgi:predicted metal-dependent phosphoesterase TrpH
MRRFVDLHVHSTASDGAMSPADLVVLAERKRLAAIALTDHDTTAGLPEAAEAAEGLGVRLICGIEVSARWPDGTLHILGLGFDPSGREIQGLACRLRACRDRRNPKMVARLRAMGVDISMDELAAQARGGVVGRLHMANLLVAKGCVRGIAEAFERFLGPGAPAFVDKEKIEPPEAIESIHRAGGLTILAHPVSLNCANDAQLARVLRGLIRAGLDGIEAYHCDHDARQTRACLDLARALGLLLSGGSDFHGSAKAGVIMGRPKVPVEAVQQLLAKLPA